MHDQRLRQRELALELSLTPCFSKVLRRPTQTPNRFSGFFRHSRQTVKSGPHHQHRTYTSLKRLVNEISLSQLKFPAIKGHHFIGI
jgi:hypothetical protein